MDGPAVENALLVAALIGTMVYLSRRPIVDPRASQAPPLSTYTPLDPRIDKLESRVKILQTEWSEVQTRLDGMVRRLIRQRILDRPEQEGITGVAGAGDGGGRPLTRKEVLNLYQGRKNA